MTISNLDLIKIAFKTSFIRLFYNYKCLFGQGMCFCLKPVLEKHLKSDNEQCQIDLIEKHSVFFNCNEYLSGFAAGIILKQEEDDPGKTDKVKQVITSTLGAIGDRFFYQLVIPFMLLVSINLAFIFDFQAKPLFLGLIISLLVIFNLLTFSFRFAGVFAGYRLGTASLKLFKHPIFKNTEMCLKISIIILQLLAAANLLIWLFRQFY